MALTPYCTNDEVRAVLGITQSEIKDEVLDLPIYEMGLKRELNRISPSLPAAFSTVNGLSALTSAEQTFKEAVQVFSVYAVARQAGAPLGLSAPKSLNDDKSGFSRYADSPYRDVLERVDMMFQQARQDLVDAFAAYAGATSAAFYGMPAGLALSSRSYDPVTGA